MASLMRYLPSLAQRRVPLALTAAALYFIPPVALSIAALWLAAPAAAWSLFTFGILMAGCGTLLLLTVWRYREAYLLRKIAPLYGAEEQSETPGAVDQNDKILRFQQHFEEYQQEQARCARELDLKNEAVGRLSQELELYRHTLEGERDKHRRDSQTLLEQIGQHKILLDEYQQQIAQQRQELAAREQAIIDLENKVRDLTFELRDQKYEIQTLLKMSDLPAEAEMALSSLEEPLLRTSLAADSPQVEWLRTPGEALLLLKRCLEAARKITAPSYYTPLHAPFGHAAPTSHPLDLRRLCDSLGSERGAAILLYAPKEEKILYATPQIETLSGWNTNTWHDDGLALLGSAAPEWKSAIHRLALHGETLLTLTLPTREGTTRYCHAYLGAVPSGLFRQYVIGILFPMT